MPYCPKCDMEYVEGMTTCSDCGEPLVPSKEAYLEEQEAQMEAVENSDFESTPDVNLFRHADAYESTAAKYEDLKSSASAFYMVGGLIFVLAVLSLAGIVPLPFYGASRILMHGLLLCMGILFLFIGIHSSKKAKSIHSMIAVEEEKNKKLMDWFLASYTSESLDQRLAEDYGTMEEEELMLKRMDFIHDALITSHDLPDDGYADEMSEQIYTRLYEA